jgi:hypothetical protein
MLHVRLYAHFADHYHAFQPWIFQFASEHGIYFVRNFLAYPFMSVIRRTHRQPSKSFPQRD